MRTFDGKANVSALASGHSIQSGSDGNEWMLIGPDNRIETPSRDDVRALARRVGFWDQYREIELDAASFGPPAARIPVERVTLTFCRDTDADPRLVRGAASYADLTPGHCPMPHPLQFVTIGEAAVRINGECWSLSQLQTADIKPNHRDGVSPTKIYSIQS